MTTLADELASGPAADRAERAAAELADEVAVAVSGCPGVAGLAAGPTATHLAGRTVPGVAVRANAVQVAVVARYGSPLAETADRVRSAVNRVAPGRPVTVYIDDIVAGGTTGAEPGAAR